MINAEDQKHAVLRNAVAFLIFGLSNNLHVPLMISASEDIIKMQNDCHNCPPNIVGNSLAKNLTLNCLPDLGKPRCERMMSTGAVLLADFLPSLTIKLTVVFFMNRIPFSFRHFLVCSLQATSFILVGISTSIQMSMLGVVLGSAGAGFGEICFLALSSYYDRYLLHDKWGEQFRH
uniref:Battenin n=1 Tax=Globodera rostochiensis TaxID=31243 RepID=A0A914IB40_GLORO